MKIIHKDGNLLDAKTDVIAHQVNCQGVMGAGIALQIKNKWPIVFKEYRKVIENIRSFFPLGSCQLVEIENNKYVANLFGQNTYGKNNSRYTSYDAIYEALSELHAKMITNNLTSVAFPHGMSSGLGGADWDIILVMIQSVFKNSNITIEIWKYAV